jgi:serine protease inhibitor
MRSPARLARSPFLILAAALSLPLAGISCSDPNEPEPVRKIEALPRELTGDERELITAGEKFAFEFLAEVAADEDAGANVFVSPLSASMALGMALAGAENDTYTAMRDALGLEGLSREEIGVSYQTLIALLTNLDPSVRMEIGNSVWLRTGFVPEDEYIEDVETHFGARVSTLDFSDPTAADTINAWVSDATEGYIDGIVDPPIDPLTVAFLINAIYFQGDWTLQFDPADTRPGDFHRDDGSIVAAQFMSQSEGEFPFAWSADYVAVELPYGGEAFAMVVVVPRHGLPLEAFVAGLDADGWAAIVETMTPSETMVLLPKFKLEYEKSLNEALKALGMEPAFDPFVADFSRMHRDALELQLHISRVRQKAFIEVDEKGTTAAAVTSVEMGVTSAPPMLTADRPFLFAIRERLSGTILFLGLMHDPTEG